ncbi:Crp/Fnr family transcriptional regulator [Chitinophaga qingshengii]|uniref:Crp/Fnr family transcriptional regulator n=1 Tax=Chitinophaga qingshengii TaxID=1569794 RepID=A0ABR7TMT8_9BACT|nr:Crp/Fnr family transcriptional regulator [Chitinophaga qingshengii]MBC9931793.1 Crp/Fnr family transcriptional regulator [Chitinophaga qingshengii]
MKHQEAIIAELLTTAFQDETLRNAYYEAVQQKQFKKGDILLQQGQVCRYSYSILSGVVRGYYIKDGRDITTSFNFADDMVMSLESATRQTPSPETFEVLEDTLVEEISVEKLMVLRERFPVLEKIWTLSAESYAIWLEERLASLQFATAKERYEQLLARYPEIVRKVQLSHIASYLGITLETLSRIRAKG